MFRADGWDLVASCEAETNEPEAVHLVTVDWQRGKWAQAKGKYSREHVWHLLGGEKLQACDC
jgi:hypothetical protein